MTRTGRKPNSKTEEYMRRYELTKKQVWNLGVSRLDAMTEDARQILVNTSKALSNLRRELQRRKRRTA